MVVLSGYICLHRYTSLQRLYFSWVWQNTCCSPRCSQLPIMLQANRRSRTPSWQQLVSLPWRMCALHPAIY